MCQKYYRKQEATKNNILEKTKVTDNEKNLDRSYKIPKRSKLSDDNATGAIKQEPPISQFAMIIAKCIEVGLEEELLIFVEIILLFHSLWTFLHVVYGKCIQSIHGRSLPVD
ncbi:hypothetical protein HUJ04_000554 [Dendroctonus ponderosae]|nr:hypothetical protein HUJ04_000554 [Dendroctonus ponderosae]